MVVKRRDWRKWRDGLRSCAFRAGGIAISTQAGSLLATNGLAHMGIPGLANMGMNWKTALGSLVVQFVLHTAVASGKYVAENPDPPETTEEIDTAMIRKKVVIADAKRELIGLSQQKVAAKEESKNK